MIPRICACLCIGVVLVPPVPNAHRTAEVQSVAIAKDPPTRSESLIPSTGSLPGIVRPSQQVELIAPVDGILTTINVAEGQRVRTGEILAQFDDEMALAAVRVAEAAAGDAEVAVAQVDLKLANAELRRILSVPDKRALADIEVDRAKAAVERADAAVNRAEQQHRRALGTLDVEKCRLQQLYLKAPFDGVVTRITTQPGASLVRAAPIVTVANLSQLTVELFADLKHFPTLNVGEYYIVDAAAPVNSTLTARLVSREPIIDAATRTFRCVFEIPNADGRLPAGFTVQFSGVKAKTNVACLTPRFRDGL